MVAVVGFVLLLVGVVLGAYLVQQKQIFRPKASEIQPSLTPETSFAIKDAPVIVNPGTNFTVSVNVKSDIDTANLFAAKLKFPADLLEVKSIAISSGNVPSSTSTEQLSCKSITVEGATQSKTSSGDTVYTVAGGSKVNLTANITGSGKGAWTIPGRSVGYSDSVANFDYTPDPTNYLSIYYFPKNTTGQNQSYYIQTTIGNDKETSSCTTNFIVTPASAGSEAVVQNNQGQNVTTNITSFIKNWVENYYDNQAGTVSLVGGVPSPGFRTQTGDLGTSMAKITFTVKKVGEATISFDQDSAIYRNSDNTNILNIRKDATVKIMAETTPSPTPVSQTERVGVKVTCATGADLIYPAGPHIDAYISGAVNYPAYNGDTNQMFWTTLVETETGKESILSADAADRTANVAVNVHGQTSPIRSNVIFPLQTGKGYEGRVYVAPWTTSIPVFTAGQLLSKTAFAASCTAPGTTVAPTPLPVKGDVNTDGKVTLVDMSVLLTQWGQVSTGADLNGDGVVNSFDYALMKNILIEAKVIRTTI